MLVGISFPYGPYVIGRAGLRLARFFASLGTRVTIHSRVQPRPVSPEWDRRVRWSGDVPFRTWMRPLDVVVALEPPDPDSFSRPKNSSIRRLLWVPLDGIEPGLRESYALAEQVVCSSKAAAAVLTAKWGLRNAVHVPWDPGSVPLRRRPPAADRRLRFLFPFTGIETASSDPELLFTAWRLLEAFPHLDVTFAYDPKNVTAVTHRSIQRTAAHFGPSGRFETVRSGRSDRSDPRLLYGRHDLVVWGSETSGTSTLGLEALAVGTPVAAYDVSPHNEYLYDRKNAALVPCAVRHDLMGVPSAVSSPEAFETRLIEVLTDPDQLPALFRMTQFGAHSRRQLFAEGWKAAAGLQ